jgi:prolyl-tRNA editing enzyme YbaK/EbsC (Cys-tRNA(Pro) deacylase)
LSARRNSRSTADKDLLAQPEVFFEVGDHEHLVRMSGRDFRVLQAGAEAIETERSTSESTRV